MARPEPVRVRNDLALRVDEDGDRALPVLVLGAAADAGKGHDAVVDDDTNLRVGRGGAGEHCEGELDDDTEMGEGRGEGERKTGERNVRWNWMLVAKGARCEALNARCSGMRSAGRGPPSAKLVRFNAVMTSCKEVGQYKCIVEWRRLTVENDDFMCSVDVEALAQRKRRRVVIQRGVRG